MKEKPYTEWSNSELIAEVKLRDVEPYSNPRSGVCFVNPFVQVLSKRLEAEEKENKKMKVEIEEMKERIWDLIKIRKPVPPVGPNPCVYCGGEYGEHETWCDKPDK